MSSYSFKIHSSTYLLWQKERLREHNVDVALWTPIFNLLDSLTLTSARPLSSLKLAKLTWINQTFSSLDRTFSPFGNCLRHHKDVTIYASALNIGLKTQKKSFRKPETLVAFRLYNKTLGSRGSYVTDTNYKVSLENTKTPGRNFFTAAFFYDVSNRA